MKSNKIVLLGCGFTGNYLLKLFREREYEVFPTSRSGKNHELDYKSESYVKFDLSDDSTWKNIPDGIDIIWLFPAEPIEKVKQFSSERNIAIVLGATSAYKSKTGIIDENSELINESARIIGEEFLRSTGTTVLRCAGIYDEIRHPINWLKKGLIKNGNKTVNLIHAADLAEIIFRIYFQKIRGEVFCVSDGAKYGWNDIVNNAKLKDLVDLNFVLFDGESENRQISNSKLMSTLKSDFKFRKFMNSF